MKLEIDVPDAIAKELAKKDRRIAQLEKECARLSDRVHILEDIFSRMKKAKDALLDAADYIDPWRYDDD